MYLIFLLLIVLLYKLYSVREGFYHSINPCFTKDTPYIKFDNMYVCFDASSNVEDTLKVFYGKEKNCLIDPKGKTMNLYSMDGTLVDVITDKITKSCKPYSVNIVKKTA